MADATEFHSGLNITEPDIFIMPDVKRLAEATQAHVKSNEFSLLFKGVWISNGFLVTDDYLVPKHKASPAAVDYKEDLHDFRSRGYNVIVHSHPSKGKNISFSKADMDYINSHFPCSLLFNEEGCIAKATILLDTPNTMVKLRIVVDDKNIHDVKQPPIDVVGLDNIEIAEPNAHIHGGGYYNREPHGKYQGITGSKNSRFVYPKVHVLDYAQECEPMLRLQGYIT